MPLVEAAGAPLVRLRDVSFTYQGDASPTLEHIDLSLPERSITTVVGASGSGKTTLASVINGIAPHAYPGTFTGDVLVDGLDPRTTPLAEMGVHVGLVPQDPELMFCNLRVEDEVAFGPENLGLPPERVREVTDRALADVGLEGHGRRTIWQLSGGQVQRLGVACVLAARPPVLIFDEPTANLDPAAVEQVHELLAGLRERGHAVVLLSKEVDEFAARGDQLVVLERGTVRFSGPPLRVLADHGAELLAEGSIWLPQATEVALRLGVAFRVGEVPVTPDDLVRLLQPVARNGGPSPPKAGGDDGRPPAVLASHLDHHYRGGITALRDVSFAIPPGRFTAIVGQNGAGKSTLAKVMCGLIRPTRGELVVGGRAVRGSGARHLAGRVGLVFQSPEHQFLTDTVFDEVAYTLRARGLTDEEEIGRRVGSVLEMLDLQDDRRRHPFGLSGGKKRRLGVAAMLAADPEVLVVDEPTYGQDRAMTASLMRLMQRMTARGVTVVLITHDMRLVQEHADHVIVMAAGRAVFEGPVDDLYDRRAVLEAAALRRPALDVILEHARDHNRERLAGVRTLDDLVAAYGGER